jgi:hypothetical protein
MTAFPCILPPRVNGFPVDYMPAEGGGVDVAIWQDERRDEGFLIHCADWAAVRKLVADVMNGGGR